MTRDEVYSALMCELARQRTLHPGQTCADNVDDGFRLAVLTEEVGEVAKSVLDGDGDGLTEEIVQVGAVCLAWLQRGNSLPYVWDVVAEFVGLHGDCDAAASFCWLSDMVTWAGRVARGLGQPVDVPLLKLASICVAWLEVR